MALEVAPSLYITWLAPTLLPIINWKEGVRYSNYSKEKGRELAVTIKGREKGRERELEFPIATAREVEEARGIVKERELELYI